MIPAPPSDKDVSAVDKKADQQARDIADALEELRSLLSKIRRADEYVNGYSLAEMLQAGIAEIGEPTDTFGSAALETVGKVGPSGYSTRFSELNRLEYVTLAALDHPLDSLPAATTADVSTPVPLGT